ncbi:uncharacterized protein LOC134224241 [Armigeres subalbatus]|uniref:uncharacterized protein LOC134224241 n=1 Tax=Armigeres subalbatus TaxID=124917 RepID=UPI002ED1ADFA
MVPGHQSPKHNRISLAYRHYQLTSPVQHHYPEECSRTRFLFRRWRTEYLSLLQSRTKRWKPPVEITVGKLVVLKDENSPPAQWKLGRIMEVHPGSDGVVRVVSVKTATGYLKRPVEKVCLLPPANQPPDEENQS